MSAPIYLNDLGVVCALGDGRAAVAQGRDFVTAGAAEDREMACAAQRGLATRANDHFTFGLFEGAIRHFHQNLAAIIERGASAR